MDPVTLDTDFKVGSLCCAVTSKQSQNGLELKAAWIKERMGEGLVFCKAGCAGKSGKVFIEYIPSEYAWAPVESKNCYHINCLWVSGRFAGKGFGRTLIEDCAKNAEKNGKDGITVICGLKKIPYLADPAFLKKCGFETVDTWRYYQIMIKKLNSDADAKFASGVGKTENISGDGLHIFYTNQCPFTEYYVQTALKTKAEDERISLTVTKIDSLAQAKNAPVPWTTYGAFFNGQYVGHEIISTSNFHKKLYQHL